MFKEVDSKMNLAENEKDILAFWDEQKIFEKSLEQTATKPLYSFYDGPPFATGSPHYGHILQSITKDVVPRYWTMQGYHVPRVWGWDCHGLPIENIVEKELGITHKKEIEELGVDQFCQKCRSKILDYVPEWKRVIRRLGRWVDMENPYMTMDLSYMESVWAVFKQLWDKGLIYESYRSMHICPRCETTLSQSEVAEGYRDVKDLSVVAKFELVDEPDTFVLAWTTTPWTLIGNVALAVGKDIEYAKISAQYPVHSTQYIVAKDRVKEVFRDQPYEIVEEFKGRDLFDKNYKPLFNFYSDDKNLKNRENGWKIVAADFVTTDEGTGIVHTAPAFGEDDLNLGKKLNLPFIQHVGMDGIIKPECGEFAGQHVKPLDDTQKTDVEIIKYLAAKNLLFSKEKYEHSYPHCWRCDTPLLNYATTSWFVNVLKLKEDAIDLAQKINWSPKHIKDGRFGKWLEGARDWSISRQRFWASVIPLWKCEKCGDHKVIGSVSELEELSGEKITDLHKDKIDPVTFKCSSCSGTMKRIPDVLDTWFDSGSMPYAQLHYPFDPSSISSHCSDNHGARNTEELCPPVGFPADFIGEAQDQTRAWFYYLHILSTALHGEIAYKNVVVSGIILAEDGKKMSKRLQNYPDPMAMFDRYGADVIRYYILTSSLLQAENLNFSEKDLAEIQRGVFRMLWNSYSFFVLYANIDNWKPGERVSGEITPVGKAMDDWILAKLSELVDNVNIFMTKYDLTKSARLFAPFIDDLSNWYIRNCRKRFWKTENCADKDAAYHTLYEVLTTLAKLMAPFTPFLADEIYKNLTNEESVHLADYPKTDKNLANSELIADMIKARKIIEIGLSIRAEAGIKVRQPLLGVVYHDEKRLDTALEVIIINELNMRSSRYEHSDVIKVELDTEITDDLRLEGFAREIIRNIQTLRKSSGFNVEDRIILYYQTDSKLLVEAFDKYDDQISHEVLALETKNEKTSTQGEAEYNIDGENIWIGINRK